MKKCVLVFFCFMFLIQASCLAHKGVTLTDGKFLDRYQSLAYSLDTDIAVEARIMQRLPEERNGNEIVYSFVTNELTGVTVFKIVRRIIYAILRFRVTMRKVISLFLRLYLV